MWWWRWWWRQCGSLALAGGALAGVLLGTPVAAGQAPEVAVGVTPEVAPEVALAQTFVAAWNAHDPAAVAALFVAAGQVHQRGGTLLDALDGVHALDVFGTPLSYQGIPPRPDGEDLVWAERRGGVERFASRLFAAGHRVVATNYRSAGAQVTWEYTTAPAAPGLPVGAGSVEMAVERGRIVRLTLVADSAAVAQRRLQLAAILEAVTPPVEPAPETPRVADTQRRATPSLAPWALAVGASLAGSLLAAVQRRPAD